MSTEDLESRVAALEERLEELELHAIARLRRQTKELTGKLSELGAILMALTGLGFAAWRSPDAFATALIQVGVPTMFGGTGLLLIILKNRDKDEKEPEKKDAG